VNAAQLQAQLTSRWNAVEERIAAACRRAGRRRDEVTLVAVTKTVSIEVGGLLLETFGPLDLGESRPQELWRKAAAVPTTVRWHLIGHLQRNKIERTLPLIHLLHSGDSLRLLKAVDEEAAHRQQPAAVLLEVNASRERNKHGFTPEELPGLVPQLAALGHVVVKGLMTMAAQEDDPEQCRPTFVLLRSLRDRLRGDLGPPHRLDELSMGMSSDFEVAIQEGATMVRIGSALFDGLTG
jgi:pyridoxal phosphate enzyme (YggS family)